MFVLNINWKNMKKIFVFSILGFSLAFAGCTVKSNTTEQPTSSANSTPATAINNNQEEAMETTDITRATISTNFGDIIVKFYNDDAPKTVNNFVKLGSEGFYDGVKFHRVIKDFMIQTGDPLSKDDSLKARWGTGGPGYKFEDEFNSHKLVKGSLAMANSGPNTNGSQFFIVTADATPWLDGRHTNFGEVIDGMDVVDKINEVATDGPQGSDPVTPIIINEIRLAK